MYTFKEKFELESIKSSSFVSALNFPKIIAANVGQSKLQYFVDGNLMAILLFLRHGRKFEKVNFDFSGIASKVLARIAESDSRNILFCGGSQSDIDTFIEYIKDEYPLLKSRAKGINGYYVEEVIVEEACKYEIVVLGLGSPKQEIVGEKILAQGKVDLLLTCGAFITQTANSKGKKYYPRWAEVFSLRWLYRMLNERGHYKRLIFALFYSYRSYRKIERIRPCKC